MNEDIKEMLWKIKRQNTYDDIGYFKTPLSNDDADKLLNYITNLQKENEELKENIRKDKVQFECFELAQECDNRQDKIDLLINQLQDYKQRNEKAIEYLENNLQSFLYSIEYKTLLSILKGGDEE